MAQRVAIGIEYDGRAFCGWQTQPGGCAIQDRVEAALAQVHGAPVATIAAGRTDAGVHALAQVVHFDAEHVRPASAWVRGVNAFLPAGISVLWARAIGDGFDARRSAIERFYRYFLINRSVRPALLAGRVGWLHGEIDDAAMQAAATHLGAKETVRGVQRLTLEAFTVAEEAPAPVAGLGAGRAQLLGAIPGTGIERAPEARGNGRAVAKRCREQVVARMRVRRERWFAALQQLFKHPMVGCGVGEPERGDQVLRLDAAPQQAAARAHALEPGLLPGIAHSGARMPSR